MSDRLFDLKASRTAPFGLFGWIFMGTILGGIPLLGLVFVIAEMGASEPGVAAAVAAVCLVPIAILYGVHRLFTKFRLSILADGSVEFVEPFKTTRIANNRLSGAHWRSTYVAAAKTRMNWLVLSDSAGTGVAAIPPSAFGVEALKEFVAALQKLKPGLTVSQS